MLNLEHIIIAQYCSSITVCRRLAHAVEACIAQVLQLWTM